MTRKREKQIKALCEINGISPVFIFRNKLAGGGYAFFVSGGKKGTSRKRSEGEEKKSTSGMRKENKNRRSCMEGRGNK